MRITYFFINTCTFQQWRNGNRDLLNTLTPTENPRAVHLHLPHRRSRPSPDWSSPTRHPGSEEVACLKNWAATKGCITGNPLHSRAALYTAMSYTTVSYTAVLHNIHCRAFHETSWNALSWKARLCMLWSMAVYGWLCIKTARLCRGSPVGIYKMEWTVENDYINHLLVIPCPCGVWCRGLTTCPLYVGPLFGNLV